jgi:hypothetical protein
VTIPAAAEPIEELLGRAADDALSRRALLRRGALAAGGLAGLGLLTARPAFAADASPKPIPGGFNARFQPVPSNALLHVFVPAPGGELATITDLDGMVAATEIQGIAKGSDGSTLSFDCDMRFMQGMYIAEDRQLRQGTFGFIGVDLYPKDAVGDPKQQLHDFEPGIAPSGLFWTRPISPAATHVDLDTGKARFHGRIALHDYGNFFNAIARKPNPPPKPSHVTFDVRWLGDSDHKQIRNPTYGFSGEFVDGQATIEFSASNDGSPVVYRSVAKGQKTLYAGVGRERNGIFFA